MYLLALVYNLRSQFGHNKVIAERYRKRTQDHSEGILSLKKFIKVCNCADFNMWLTTSLPLVMCARSARFVCGKCGMCMMCYVHGDMYFMHSCHAACVFGCMVKLLLDLLYGSVFLVLLFLLWVAVLCHNTTE